MSKHIVKTQSWLNGELSVFEQVFESIEDAAEHTKHQHHHHSENSDSHSIKIYNEHGEIVQTVSAEDTSTNTYA